MKKTAAPAPAPAAPAPADPAAPSAKPGAPAEPGATEAFPKKVRPEDLQTAEERDFYAPNYLYLTILSVILFFPLGIPAAFFCYQVQGSPKPTSTLPSLQTFKANQESRWEDAYVNSGRTCWLDVFAILIGLGIIYYYVLFM
ncbi:transmembrane protein PMIS2 [Tenrec ecaudatus]|uniref:transmembrane protein PMIS2 n=1 Tax=Tenrec ecaudatus TaxID=94439 RepID=UPI003F595412